MILLSGEIRARSKICIGKLEKPSFQKLSRIFVESNYRNRAADLKHGKQIGVNHDKSIANVK